MVLFLSSPTLMKGVARLEARLEAAAARLGRRRGRTAPEGAPEDPPEKGPRFWRARFREAEAACDVEGASAALAAFEAAVGHRPRGLTLGRLGLMRRSPLGQAALMARLAGTGDARADAPASEPGVLCYVLNNALPETSNGYAVRSHEMARALAAEGWRVTALTRPGFPWDLGLTPAEEGAGAAVAPAASPAARTIEHDGVLGRRVPSPGKRGLLPADYAARAADALEAELRRLRPAAVLAASNHLVALPALAAARRLGLPFVYEVRGFWEVTRASRDAAFAAGPGFAGQRALEALVAGRADAVATLNGAMRDELVARGVAPERIALAPNGVDPDRLVPRAREPALAARLGLPEGTPVIGYVGSFAPYEGLGLLIEACARLRAGGAAFRLLLVGGAEGDPAAARLRAQAEAAGLGGWLATPGRAGRDEIPALYGLIDLAAFPRLPQPVCELVTPVKPLEAMACATPLLAADVAPLAELVRLSGGGETFAKGSAAALEAGLGRLIADPAALGRLGAAGRRWVEAERRWSVAARAVSAALALAGARPEGGLGPRP